MISDFFKNSSPMTFYIISIISFFIANYLGNKNLPIYFSLLVIGLVFFVLGILKRFRSR
jgi:pilus assembly protein TadC